MTKFTKEEIQALAKEHMFSLSEEEVVRAQVASEVFLKQIQYLHLIDTSSTESMDMPFDEVTEWLRDDIVDDVMERDALLKNAPKTEGDYIEIVKVLV